MVFEGKIPTIVHTCEVWGVMQAIRMFHDEFGLRMIATHTEGGGYMIGAEAAKRERVFIDIGPRLMDFTWGAEDDGRIHGICAEYVQRGVKNISLNTDSISWGDQEDLPFQATVSAHFGLDELTALKALTINPARALGIDDRVGSLEVGKDADIVLKQGSYLDATSPVDLVLINGRIAYRREGVDFGVSGKTSALEKAEPQP
jgi:imidazolonepropionase-like amidohydrolase